MHSECPHHDPRGKCVNGVPEFGCVGDGKPRARLASSHPLPVSSATFTVSSSFMGCNQVQLGKLRQCREPSSVTMGNIRDPSSRTGSPAAVLCMMSVLEHSWDCRIQVLWVMRTQPRSWSSVNVTLRHLLHRMGFQTRTDQIHDRKLLPDCLPQLHQDCQLFYSCHPCRCSLSTRNCPFSTTPNFQQ